MYIGGVLVFDRHTDKKLSEKHSVFFEKIAHILPIPIDKCAEIEYSKHN